MTFMIVASPCAVALATVPPLLPAIANTGRHGVLAMVFKRVESAQGRWWAVNAPHLVALVRAGDRFERGQLIECPELSAA